MTRAFSICVIIVLLIALGISVYGALNTIAPADSYPRPEEVFARLAPRAGRSPRDTVLEEPKSELPSVTLPFNVQRYLSDPESRSVLLNQLAGLAPDERDGYLKNLAAVVEGAEKMGSGAAGNAIYVYMQLTTERQHDIASRKEALKAQRWQAVEIAAAILMLVALFSLILVLLAIERNTRSSSPAA